MALNVARKRKSNELDDVPNTPTQTREPKRMKITQTQKQALIDNLQLEITERARQLRAHYALQCQDLKARIERRINRVPVAMRKIKMVDLMAQQQKTSNTQATVAATVHNKVTKSNGLTRHSVEPEQRALPVVTERQQQNLPSPTRKPVPQPHHPLKSRKRKSSAIHIPSDRENESQADGGELDTSNAPIESDSLPVQKNTKRAKTTITTAVAPKRTTSKVQKKPAARSKDTDSHKGILSPRSHNSRTLPRSPIKDTQQLPPSPTRPVQFAHNSPLRQQPPPPALQSPQRPPSPFKAATSAISAFAKRGAAAAANLRPSSRDKDTSAAATVTGTLASPVGKMLPPARPALAAVTSSSAHAVPTLASALSSAKSLSQSPQRTVSQTSMRSAASEQSTTSTNGTVVTKPHRSGGTKQEPQKRTVKKTTTTTVIAAAAATRTKAVISEIAVAPLSPKTGNTTRGGVKRAATTAAARATAAVKRAGTMKKAAATTTTEVSTTAIQTGTGRVLRKRY